MPLSVDAQTNNGTLASGKMSYSIPCRNLQPWHLLPQEYSPCLTCLLRCRLGWRHRWLRLYERVYHLPWSQPCLLVLKETERSGLLFYRSWVPLCSQCCVWSDLALLLAIWSSHRHPTASVIYYDNVGETYLCANPVFHSCMKHIVLDYHFTRNMIQAGQLRVSHVSTRDQLADALTKPLPQNHFQQACNKIGVYKGPPSWGGVLKIYVIIDS